MTLTFRKTKYEDIPEQIRQRVESFNRYEVVIDDTGLTRIQLKKLTDFMEERGYKETP